MKDSTKTKPKREMARDLFAELSEGMKTLAEERLGKRTLRTHPLNKPATQFTKDSVVEVRS